MASRISPLRRSGSGRSGCASRWKRAPVVERLESRSLLASSPFGTLSLAAVRGPATIHALQVMSTVTFLNVQSPFPPPNRNYTLTAEVQIANSGTGHPPFTGTVTFTDNGNAIATEPVSATGIAKLVRPFSVGMHTLVAKYSGDRNFKGSTSTSTTIFVTAGAGAGRVEPSAVLGVQRFGFHAQPTILTVFFATALDPSRAQNPANYVIVGPVGAAIPVLSASYDPAAESVTLVPSQSLDLHKAYQFTIVAQPPNGLTDAEGVPIDGAGNGQPGSNFVAFLTAANLVIPGFTPARTLAFLRSYRLA